MQPPTNHFHSSYYSPTGHNPGQQASPFIYGGQGQIQNQFNHGGAQPAPFGHQMLACGVTPFNYAGQGQIQNQLNHGGAQPPPFGHQVLACGVAQGGAPGVPSLTMGESIPRRKECCDLITCGECIDNMKQRGRWRLECGCGAFVYELDKRVALSAASDGRRSCQGCLRRIIVISPGASRGRCSNRIDSSGSWMRKRELGVAGSGAEGPEKKRNNGDKKFRAVQIKTLCNTTARETRAGRGGR